MERFWATVVGLEVVGEVKVVKLLPDKEVAFEAGQFFRLWGEVEGKRIFRPYSVASPPSYPYLEFAIHILERGTFTKGFVDGLKVGDRVEVDGPFGHFTLKEGDAVFVAGGVGIAPIMSLLRHISAQALYRKHRYTLYYSSRHLHSTPFLSEILSYGWLEKVITFTKEEVRGFRHGRFGKEDFVGQWDVAYICGGRAFGQMVKEALEGRVGEVKAELWG